MKDRKWKHRRPQKAFSRAERKEQIMGQFAIWQHNQDTKPKTMNRIAKALGMSPAQNVTDMLLELVAEGKLAFKEHDKKGRWTGRDYYSLVETLITEKCGRRRIVVKHKGVERGQLELFAREGENGWHNDYERDLRERARSTTGENLAREQYMDMQP